MNDPSNDNLSLATQIVASYVSNHTVSLVDLPNLISSVFKSLNTVGQLEAPVVERPQPAVPIKKSVTDSFIVCLEDGRKLKMLKRYLHTRYSMTPAEYRQRWGLPHDYPMVAPAYAAQRSTLAKQIGLGRKPAPQPELPLQPEPTPELEAAAEPAKRRAGGRRKVA